MKTFDKYLLNENIKPNDIKKHTLQQFASEINNKKEFILQHVDGIMLGMNAQQLLHCLRKEAGWKTAKTEDLDKIMYTYRNGNCIFDSSDGTLKYADDGIYLIAPRADIIFIKNGELHRSDGPAIIEIQTLRYYFNGDFIASYFNSNVVCNFTLRDTLNIFNASIKDILLNIISTIDYEKILEGAKKVGQDRDIILFILKHSDDIEKKLVTKTILHSIQPDVFSDKMAKALMDKIPLNLAYFILTKHMELYNNILKCYSDKTKFIEDIKEGDEIHHMGIASALERLIKHEDV